ncbi:hypothetical protein EVAR_11661_1 [Eumeta japonica]|uniref:PiggyBac transposable element-derived protein 4 C-terminal zinc-finger domain-containing protein n=1 Tax=Eumeta variegata TaxID=151549 RepID=A0A4C1U5Z6_EUMVA|nr:hypothetical protein EVAR_11661_1 [Eumeta japonica]
MTYRCHVEHPTHTITRITEKNSNGRIKQKHCRQCYKQKKRSDTTWHCVACNDKPGLCVECFDLYHEELLRCLLGLVGLLRAPHPRLADDARPPPFTFRHGRPVLDKNLYITFPRHMVLGHLHVTKSVLIS